MTYLLELGKLDLPKLIECVRVTFLHLTQAHVTDAIAHFSHIQQCRSQRLKYATNKMM